MLFRSSKTVIKRGQLHTSIGHLSKRWGWSYKKVVRFLDLLKSLEMVQTDGRANGTTITLVNYGFYQGQGQANDRTNDLTNDQADDRADSRADDRQTIMNNNVRINNKSHSQTADDINRLFEKMRKEGKL